MIFATTPATEQQPGFGAMDLLFPLVLVALIVFMFWSSRRRTKRMKEEQEAKARQMLPGVEVLLQGGLYGTLVEFDGEDLSRPAVVELAPGVQIKVHSQGILRVVEPEGTDVPGDDLIDDATPDDVTPDGDDKPKA
ncbi:preprotein translocase subunit YajC [Microbacterium sp. No. 7]|uniref:preprotein translocase subunit YajC n=1 Tax=Microbacterium sp. No. 7 TaxID=1714373 RepID=UPI0006D2BB86|nr:preprotein translocase subunit YajC [Microbacterium sp. No. 7]ALJ20150.1 hypothetical protein AOA12_09600 [Microbacterium sp. No. 7]